MNFILKNMTQIYTFSVIALLITRTQLSNSSASIYNMLWENMEKL